MNMLRSPHILKIVIVIFEITIPSHHKNHHQVIKSFTFIHKESVINDILKKGSASSCQIFRVQNWKHFDCLWEPVSQAFVKNRCCHFPRENFLHLFFVHIIILRFTLLCMFVYTPAREQTGARIQLVNKNNNCFVVWNRFGVTTSSTRYSQSDRAYPIYETSLLPFPF